jgi:hypothetical protein
LLPLASTSYAAENMLMHGPTHVDT